MPPIQAFNRLNGIFNGRKYLPNGDLARRLSQPVTTPTTADALDKARGTQSNQNLIHIIMGDPLPRRNFATLRVRGFDRREIHHDLKAVATF
jgi:hypothetical protein